MAARRMGLLSDPSPPVLASAIKAPQTGPCFGDFQLKGMLIIISAVSGKTIADLVTLTQRI
jgi:hypothetical protein